RPPALQRWELRVLKRCGRAALAIRDFLAKLLLPSFGERQAQPTQKRVRLLVRLGVGRDGYVEAPDGAHVVVRDLGEDDLLANADRVVPAPVEGARVEATEVA